MGGPAGIPGVDRLEPGLCSLSTAAERGRLDKPGTSTMVVTSPIAASAIARGEQERSPRLDAGRAASSGRVGASVEKRADCGLGDAPTTA